MEDPEHGAPPRRIPGDEIFRVSDFFILQTSGVPIGGPLSGYLLDLVLCWLEHTYDKNNNGRDRTFTSIRYADDLGLFSRVLCQTCLKKRIFRIFGNSMDFSSAGDSVVCRPGHVMQKFLDFDIHFSFYDLDIALTHPNELFAFTANPAHRQKQNISPFVGRDHSLIKRCRAEARGKITRWERVAVPMWNLAVLVVVELLLYAVAGHPFSSLRRIWSHTSDNLVTNTTINCCLDLVKVSCRPLFELSSLGTTLVDGHTAAIHAQLHCPTGALASAEPATHNMGGWGHGGGKQQQWNNGGGHRGGQGGGRDRYQSGGGGSSSHAHPYQRDGGGGGGFGGEIGGMAAQFDHMVSGMQALSKMTRLATALESSDSPLATAHSRAATDTATTLHTALSRDQRDDTKLQDVVRRLAEITGASPSPAQQSGASQIQPRSLIEEPEFVALRAQVERLGTTVNSHTSDLAVIKDTVGRTDGQLTEIKQMIAVIASQSSGGGTPRAPPPAASPPAGGLTSPRPLFSATVDADLVPLLEPDVDLATLQVLCRVLSVDGSRSGMSEISAELPTSFTNFWHKFGRLKAIAQWRSKLGALGSKARDSELSSMKDIGAYVYSHLARNDTFSTAPLQAPPEMTKP